MQRIPELALRTIAVMLAGLISTFPAQADKPPWAGGGKQHGQEDRSERHGNREREDDHDRHGSRKHARFVQRDKVVIREYYVEDHRRGRCPPGLAKKHNGCMPPGQAKKWGVGHPLPREVVRYELPPALIVKLGAPPPGYQYIRVASDILLIAIGTSMVVDAIQDLGLL